MKRLLLVLLLVTSCATHPPPDPPVAPDPTVVSDVVCDAFAKDVCERLVRCGALPDVDICRSMAHTLPYNKVCSWERRMEHCWRAVMTLSCGQQAVVEAVCQPR